MSHQGQSSQYAAASRVPLIQSPSIMIPPAVEMPPDIHPLPDSVTPYFVYPFTLEPHVVTLETARRTTMTSHAARREAYLKSRNDDKERRKRDALRRIAPGFEPQSGPLVPIKRVLAETHAAADPPQPPKSVMEDLVDRLAAMDSSSSSPA